MIGFPEALQSARATAAAGQTELREMQETQNAASAAVQMITRQMAIASSAEDAGYTDADYG